MLFPDVCEEVVDEFGDQTARVVDPSYELRNHLKPPPAERERERERGEGERGGRKQFFMNKNMQISGGGL